MRLALPLRPAIGRNVSLRLLVMCLLLLLANASLQAQQQQDDLRRIQDQRSAHRAIERERELLKDELEGERPTLTVEGKTYTIEHNANDVGRALYLALQQRQWPLARHFLDEYLTLAERDPLLVHYAQGILARVKGQYRKAVREFTTLLELQPDFLLGRLELARVLFEDQQDREASALFSAIAASIDTSDAKTSGVLKTIASFRQALHNRRNWSGSLAFGPAWSDNVNRTSASQTCLAYLEGTCFYTRATPDPIVSSGIDYDASLSRRLPLRGHHGLYVHTQLFGQNYRDNSNYNESLSSTEAGYSYRSGRHQFSLAPAFDYQTIGNSAFYGAWGAHAEWTWTLSPRWLMKLEGDWKDQRHRNASYARNLDGPIRSGYATGFFGLSPRWNLFAGLDVVDKTAPEATNAYLQKGMRLGTSLQWPTGISSTLFASRRWRDYSAYSAMLEARRADIEDNYILIVKASRWSFANFTPLLTLRHNRIKSNVDWLYSYEKNSVNLKLERTF